MVNQLIAKIDIDKEMQQSYLDYAMSVIVSRALPDARDGLKPVHRRILYAMHDMGLRADRSHKKSARVVGEVLGKYHPHSDTAVYDAMARMAQDFSMRLPLVDGQGNFGSVDGDPPAAMRYTEARMTASAQDLMADIEKSTVDHSDNFDASLSEPDVLPAAIPNLLVNGATGIAVGMSTNIPPHNLGEVIDALNHILANWKKVDDISVDELMTHIQGPDFPTGGVILENKGEDGLSSAYGSGRGKVTMQARAHIEEIGRGREHILVTELPYQVNKAALIERIAKLARAGKLEGISDLRDESDRQGMRIVIEVSKSARAKKVLQSLYKRTQMQSTFGIILLALVDGEPRLLSLKQALKVYIEHRLEVVRRRSEHDLTRAKERAHLLEGLRVALKNLDDVIQLIRKASDVDEARAKLMDRFKLSDVQANAILDMPLRRLAALERKKIEIEYKEVRALIKSLEGLLASPKSMRDTVANELNEVKDAYGDRRRTQIVELGKDGEQTELLTTGELEKDKTVWVGVSSKGLIARSLENKAPRPSGANAPGWLLQASRRDTLYLVAENGRAAAIAIHALPEADSLAKGEAVSRVSALKASDKLAALFSLPAGKERPKGFVITASSTGIIKKSALEELPGPISQSFRIAKVKSDDRIVSAWATDGKSELLLASSDGMAIRFSEKEVRPTGLASTGVNGIKLGAKSELAAAFSLDSKQDIFFALSDGRAKRVKPSLFPEQGRYGKGVIAWKLANDERVAGAANQKGTTRATLILKKLSPKAIRLDAVPSVGRQANGKQVLELKEGDEVLRLVVPAPPIAAKAKTTGKKSKAKATSKKDSAKGISPKTKRASAKAAKRSSAKTKKPGSKGKKKS
jgi:DNA gyrase subunit A